MKDNNYPNFDNNYQLLNLFLVKSDSLDGNRRDKWPNREYREPRRRLHRENRERNPVSMRISSPPAPRGISEGYRDLDDPIAPPSDNNKDPWGFLAQNWNKKATQDHLDYQSLLRQHVTGNYFLYNFFLIRKNLGLFI